MNVNIIKNKDFKMWKTIDVELHINRKTIDVNRFYVNRNSIDVRSTSIDWCEARSLKKAMCPTCSRVHTMKENQSNTHWNAVQSRFWVLLCWTFCGLKRRAESWKMPRNTVAQVQSEELSKNPLRSKKRWYVIRFCLTNVLNTSKMISRGFCINVGKF